MIKLGFSFFFLLDQLKPAFNDLFESLTLKHSFLCSSRNTIMGPVSNLSETYRRRKTYYYCMQHTVCHIQYDRLKRRAVALFIKRHNI